MDQRKARLEERIRSVQISFVASLPQTMNDINSHWGSLRHTAWELKLVQELQSIVHRLAGSGGTFGFPDISRTAAVLDTALQGRFDLTVLAARHLLLPAVALGTIPMAIVAAKRQ